MTEKPLEIKGDWEALRKLQNFRGNSETLQQIKISQLHLGVFKHIGKPPKSSILVGYSVISHPFWGIPLFGNIHFANPLWLCWNTFFTSSFWHRIFSLGACDDERFFCLVPVVWPRFRASKPQQSDGVCRMYWPFRKMSLIHMFSISWAAIYASCHALPTSKMIQSRCLLWLHKKIRPSEGPSWHKKTHTFLH